MNSEGKPPSSNSMWLDAWALMESAGAMRALAFSLAAGHGGKSPDKEAARLRYGDLIKEVESNPVLAAEMQHRCDIHPVWKIYRGMDLDLLFSLRTLPLTF